MTRRQGLIQTEHGVYSKDHVGAEPTCVTVTRGDACPSGERAALLVSAGGLRSGRWAATGRDVTTSAGGQQLSVDDGACGGIGRLGCLGAEFVYPKTQGACLLGAALYR